MSSTFDNLYLPGGDSFASQEELDFDLYENSDFTAINTNVQPYSIDHTVSPHEVMNDTAVMSAAASTAFPNLHTPSSSYLESPAMGSSNYNTSPLEDGALDQTLNYDELATYEPLFPQDDSDQFSQTMPLADNMHKMSFTSVQSQMKPSPALSRSSMASPMIRQRSSPGRPPTNGHARKPSLTSGVAKVSKARNKTLPEIEITEEDSKEIAKRKKNTAAARKSRQRKMEHQDVLETEIQRLRNVIERMGGNPDEGMEYD